MATRRMGRRAVDRGRRATIATRKRQKRRAKRKGELMTRCLLPRLPATPLTVRVPGGPVALIARYFDLCIMLISLCRLVAPVSASKGPPRSAPPCVPLGSCGVAPANEPGGLLSEILTQALSRLRRSVKVRCLDLPGSSRAAGWHSGKFGRETS